MKQALFAFLLTILSVSQQGYGAVLLFDEAGQNELAGPSSTQGEYNDFSQRCASQVTKICPAEQTLREDLLFGGAAKKLSCISTNYQQFDQECLFWEVSHAVDVIVEKQGSKCHDELRSKCGKQIDDLKKAVQRTSIIGTVKGAVDVVECIVSHAEDLWEKCKPGQHKKTDEMQNEQVMLSCSSRAAVFCPPTRHQEVLGVGYTLGCIADHADDLGVQCVKEQMTVALHEMEASNDKPCYDELRKKCGKQIDQLKKDIEDTSVIGIVTSAFEVVQCVAQNAEDLWTKCKPFEDEDSKNRVEEEEEVMLVAGSPTPPTHKPTPKPTHRPTKKPTTHHPTVKPTNRPTTKAIADALTGSMGTVTTLQWPRMESLPLNTASEQPVNWLPQPMPGRLDSLTPMHTEEEYDDESYDEVEEEEDEMTTEVTSVEINMDACVQSARKYCAAQVYAFNESPFDRSLLQALNDCVEFNSANIEAECVVKDVDSWSIWSDGMGRHRRHHGHGPRPHPPCRHPEDMTSNLPPCKPHHRCPHHHRRHRHAIIAGVSSLVVFLAAVLVGRRMYANRMNGKRRERCRCCGRKQVQPSEVTVVASGIAYQQLKSDNAPAVPAGNIV